MPMRNSFEKINYTIRPSKQVERKIFVEALYHLNREVLNISDYTYVGLGSIFYHDFILFHKALFINDMVCLEKENIHRRMEFNKPYKFINLRMQSASEFIPRIKKKKKYLAWLDYDEVLIPDILQDIGGFISALPQGSIFIISVDVEPKLPKDLRTEYANLNENDRTEKIFDHYNSFSKHAGTVSKADITSHDLPRLVIKIIRSKIDESLLARPSLRFFQLFNYIYNDGTEMLTLGGLIEEKKNGIKKLKNSNIYKKHYIRPQKEPLRISVPPLTTREKLFLDQLVSKNKKTNKVKFELEPELKKNFFRFYKQYPTYQEVFL